MKRSLIVFTATICAITLSGCGGRVQSEPYEGRSVTLTADKEAQGGEDWLDYWGAPAVEPRYGLHKLPDGRIIECLSFMRVKELGVTCNWAQPVNEKDLAQSNPPEEK